MGGAPAERMPPGRPARAAQVLPRRQAGAGPRSVRELRNAEVAEPRPRSRRRKVFLTVSLVFVGILGVLLGPSIYRAQQAYRQIFNTDVPRPVLAINPEGTPEIVPDATEEVKLPDWDKKERVNMLLLGVDGRDDGEIARSDTMMLVTVDPATKQVGMMSIPRDLLVTIPGLGNEKINAAYPFGDQSSITGAGLARATVEYNFKIPIHYVAEVDFQGFQKIVDTLGGVTIDVAAPIKDDEYPAENFNYKRIYFHTGLQHLDGKRALEYVRTRHDDNDFARGQRQQQVLVALRQQGVSLNLITKAPEILEELGDSIRTDMPPRDALALAKLATQLERDSIKSYGLLDATTVQWSPGEPYYLIPDWDRVRSILAEMMPEGPGGTAQVDGAGQVADLGATVVVQNATRVNRLAASAAERLAGAGFTSVRAEQSPNTGAYPASQVIDYSGNRVTARAIAEILGLPESAISAGDPATAYGNDIVVILGDDAASLAGG